MGRSDQGVFRLKQAMGGGKTRNLLVAALLADDPAERKRVLQPIGVDADGRTIRVAAFSGRETDTSDYLWVTLFRALKCEHRWQPSNQVPGPSIWANVLGDEPAVILLDERPPFFVSLGAKSAGPGTTEADRLAIALANLMNAIVSGRLPNACLVISDLAGVWGAGSVRIQEAIDNANQGPSGKSDRRAPALRRGLPRAPRKGGVPPGADSALRRPARGRGAGSWHKPAAAAGVRS